MLPESGFLNMAHYFITTKHIAYNDLQQPLGYFYRLQEKLPLSLIAGKTYSDGSPEALRANYEMERFRYLAYWSEIDPLSGVSNESLHAHPLEVTFRVSGTQHKGAVLISNSFASRRTESNIRNIHIDFIKLV
jgi:hypothetical protein